MPDIHDFVVKERKNLLPDNLVWRGILRRSWAHEYADIELKLIRTFQDAVSKYNVEVDGFVSRWGGSSVFLRPTLGVNYGVYCEITSRKFPRDHEFVRIVGNWKFPGKKTGRYPTRVLQITDWEPVKLPVDHLKPTISLNDAAEILFDKFVDVPSIVKLNTMLSLTSSPGDAFRVGGLTSTFLPTTEKVSSPLSSMVSSIQRGIPVDLTVRQELSISRTRKFAITPFLWDVHDTHVDGDGKSPDNKLLARVPHRSSMQELTVSVSAHSVVPTSLDELWIKRADLPLIVDTPIVGPSNMKTFDGELAKFLITVHMSNPPLSQEVEDNVLRLATPRLTKLRRRYCPQGSEEIIFLDIESGSTRNIIHIAKAIARSAGQVDVNKTTFDEALNQFESSFDEVFRVWEDRDYKSPHKPAETKLAQMGRTATKIYKNIKQTPYQSKVEIRESFSGIEEPVFERIVVELRETGLIYKTSENDERYAAVEE